MYGVSFPPDYKLHYYEPSLPLQGGCKEFFSEPSLLQAEQAPCLNLFADSFYYLPGTDNQNTHWSSHANPFLTPIYYDKPKRN